MNQPSGHLSEGRIQEWLDGCLPVEEAARIQAHVDGCQRCRIEVEAWRALVLELSALPALAPREGFRGSILDAVGRTAPERRPIAVRIRAHVSAWISAWRGARHPTPDRIQDLLEGTPAGWRTLLHGLSTLPRPAPSAGFAASVMARVRMPEPVPARKMLRHRLRGRLRALTGPRHRRAWAAVAGVAVTPLATCAAVTWAVFSLPLATVGNLTTFLWLKGSALAVASGGAVAARLTDSAAVVRAWSVVDVMTRSPALAGAWLLAFSALTLLALWVLYRNLFAAPAATAHVQAS